MDYQRIRVYRTGITFDDNNVPLRIENFQPRGFPNVIFEVIPDESCSQTEKRKTPVVKSLTQKISAYKSLLQKAVRRMNLGEGLKAFDWLWVNDRTSLLRRITIISLEDGFYNPSWNKFWIWLMLLDSRGYDFNDSVRLEMRNQIRELITHPLYSRKREVGKERNLEYMNNSDLIPLIIRKEYGGMPGDMQMIQNFLETYTPNLELHKLPLIHPTDGKLYEACDFHVFPWLAKTDEQRTLFWEARSCINLRDRSTFTKAVESNSSIREYDELCRRLYNSTIDQ